MRISGLEFRRVLFRSRHHLEARNVRVPRGIALRVLRGHARRGAIRPAEHDRRGHLTAGHVMGLGGGVDDLVHRLHGEVEGHELDDGPERSEAHTPEDPSLMRIPYAVFCSYTTTHHNSLKQNNYHVYS